MFTVHRAPVGETATVSAVRTVGFDLVRVLRALYQSWMAVAAGGLLVVIVVELVEGSGGAGVAAAALGALIGVIALPMGTQAGTLLGSLVFGLRVRRVELGALRRFASFQLGGVLVVFRVLPVVLHSEIGPWRRPVLFRCWLAGLTSAAAGVGIVAAGWLGAGAPFWRGWLIASVPFLCYKLWPRRVPMATSTGWLLFGLPRMPEPERTEFRVGPIAARAHDALITGDITTAQSYVDELVAAHPRLTATLSCRVALLQARGEYATAVAILREHIDSAEIAERDRSYLLAGLADLAFSAVESGQSPADEFVPIARKALDDAVSLGFPPFHLSGTQGLLALLEGDADEAARLAALGAEHDSSVLSRADNLATLARAHMARLDNAAAREALRRAEELAAWWPRVRETRARLSVG